MVKTPLKFGLEPRAGERILVLRKEWLERILCGQKDLEIRSMRLREGDIWLGCRAMILGRARLGLAVPICSTREWCALRSRHCVPNPMLPYKTTFGLPLKAITRLREGISYVHPRGAIGVVKFRPP